MLNWDAPDRLSSLLHHLESRKFRVRRQAPSDFSIVQSERAMPRKRNTKNLAKSICGICGATVLKKRLKAHKEKVHGIKVRYPKLWMGKRDDGRVKTIGPGRGAKGSDWKKVK